MFCEQCGMKVTTSTQFCGSCGAPVSVTVDKPPQPPPIQEPARSGEIETQIAEGGILRVESFTSASTGARVLACFIDILLAVLIGVIFGWIPIIGGLVLGSYWLLRDITSASLGKLLLGLRVVAKDGQPAERGALVLRNLPLALGPALLIIPVVGFLGVGIAFLALLTELVFLLAQGERVGDKMAGTAVANR